MVASPKSEYVFQASAQQLIVQPCLSADQIHSLKFPPLLFKANGQRALEGELLCRHVWLGQECRRQKFKDGCPYRHISKDDFLAELQSGSASAVPKTTWMEQLTRQRRLSSRRQRRRRDPAAHRRR